ncbi:MAG: hypothetical protein AAF560_09190 [Acidobacteriota bacterium]
MKRRIPGVGATLIRAVPVICAALVTASASFASGQAAQADSGVTAPRELGALRDKVGTTASRLLLPLYVVDTNSPNGPTTFYAILNESSTAISIDANYYDADTPYDPEMPATPRFSQRLDLIPKQIQTFNVRSFVPQLAIDGDGVARGYIVFEPVGGPAAIHGDYFRIDDEGNFASGSRLLNIDPASSGNDLCTRFSIRFLNSALLFDSGTNLTVWFQPDLPYEGQAFAYSPFDISGGDSLFDLGFPSSNFAFEVPSSLLLTGVSSEFGSIEIDFGTGVGHVSAIMSALGRLSVGFEATCLDPI